MIAEVLYGEEDWVGTISGPPVIDGFDEHGFTMSVPTDRGVLTIMVSQGDPEMTQADVDALTVALRERFEERKAEREQERHA